MDKDLKEYAYCRLCGFAMRKLINVKVTEVIKLDLTKGAGKTADDPIKSVQQYWTLDGRFLVEIDPTEEK